MCELLAITSRQPTTVSMSLEEFARHGSESGSNKDGWGIVFYADDDIRRFRDIGPAASSPWVRFVESQPLCSTMMLAHIRAANVGDIRLANTHPFSRELGGNMHTFAHNGYLQGIDKNEDFALGRYRPVGTTDSEWAFCAFLERLKCLWTNAAEVPRLAERFSVAREFAAAIRDLGVANFIYCDGDAMFVHAHRRRQSDGDIRPPGLWLTERSCGGSSEDISGGGVHISSPRQAVTVAASVPLTDDNWRPMPEGTLVAIKNGQVVHSS